MKVKNIMFSGFMAAIMMSATAGIAHAAVSVASKGYVDSKTVNASYATDSTNYLGSVTGVKNATVELDKQIKSVSDVANAAVSTETFNTFKADNDDAIADAKAAGTAASTALGEYKTANDAAVQANTSAIELINDADNGILKKAQGYTDTELDKLEESLTGTSTNLSELSGKVSALETSQGTQNTDIASLKEKVGDKTVATAIADAVSTLETKSDAAQKLADAKAYTDTEVAKVNTALTGYKTEMTTTLGDYAKTTAVTSAITEATKDLATKGTTLAHYGITDASTTTQMETAIATAKTGAETTAKGYTDAEIAKLSAIARATVPAECESTDSSLCVLTLGTNGEYKWVSLTEPVNDDGTNGTL